MNLKFKRMIPSAILPRYATEGAACFDLHAVSTIGVLPGSSEAIKTGLSVEIPPGHVMLIFSRSGHGFNNGVRLANSVGVIDSDYRGEIGVKLHNDSGQFFRVTAGDRIAQAMVIPIPVMAIMEVEELTETARGQGGFGSTGS